MFKRWYIVHNEIEGDQSFFGPFRKRELDERLNDSYADFLASDCDELEAVKLSRKQVKQLEFVAPRSFWVEQSQVMAEDEA